MRLSEEALHLACGQLWLNECGAPQLSPGLE